MTGPDTPPAGAPTDGPVFRVVRVAKEYQMGEVLVPALREISLDVQPREFLVVVGPSGSGKSTLLNIMGGMDRPTRGDVYFRHERLSAYSERQLTYYRRDHVGFVFQFYNLMPNLTAEENVALATETVANPIAPGEALDWVGLAERASHFPSQLSGGEQQRVAIARAIAKRPEILLCDEPTGALDISTGKVVLNALAAIHRELDTTVIVITHNQAIGRIADRVVRMADGRVREVIENADRASPDDVDW